MKRSCKHVDVTNPDTVLPWVADCVLRHYRRHDFRRLILRHGVSHENYCKATREHNRSYIVPCLRSIAEEACRIIRERDFNEIPEVRIGIKHDHTTGKERQIGCESPMQQVLDYIAVYSCDEIWKRRMALQQMSSIPGRGQVLGIRMIRSFIRRDNRALEYAMSHGLRYTRKSKWHVHLDIFKCFPKSKAEIFIRLFSLDCANRDIVWLWAVILFSHRVQGYRGFMIGALTSQWAAQYLISFIYHYAMSLRYRSRKAVTFGMLFMDDILFFSSSRSALKSAVKAVIKFAKSKLGYEIKGTWHIECIDRAPVDMMGFVVHANGKVTMRARNFIHARRLILRAERSGYLTYRQAVRLLCYKGFYKFSDSRKAEQDLKLNKWFGLAQSIVSRHDRRLNNAA